jgi:cobalt-zinc-cadmium efflux system membrane fusion protein
MATSCLCGNSPKRQPDGSVFLPKPSQRQLGVRTVVAEEKALPKTVELTGRVVADPNAGGKVQPTQAGRIDPARVACPSWARPCARVKRWRWCAHPTPPSNAPTRWHKPPN